MSATRHCLICSAPTTYAHLGVDSCRSCADFYKRTVVARRSYQCRKGDGKCAINQKDRHNCRGCKFEKCASVGMKYDPESSEAIPLERAVASSSQENFLSIISREHSLSMARRRICEYTLQPTSLHRAVKADIKDEKLLLCTWTFLMDCCKFCTGDFIHFASLCFPEFAALSSNDQQLMLRSVAPNLFNAEIHCETFRRFGGHDSRLQVVHIQSFLAVLQFLKNWIICMATLTTCYDTTNFEFVIEHESPDQYKLIAKSLKHYYTRIARLVGPIMKKSAFTNTEMDAIFALAVWMIDPSQSLPEHITAMARIVRRRIFDALKQYYREELHLEEYSVRLGNLEIPSILEEQIQFLSVSGMIGEEAAFLEKEEEESHSERERKEVMTAVKTFRINAIAILVNFAALYGVAFLTVLIPELLGVRQRGFYCDDTSIQRPFYDHTVPMGQMTLFALGLFFIIPLITEFIVESADSSLVSYQWWRFSVPSFIVQTLILFGYSHIGLVMQVALTQWAKFGFGRLRPHFMDVCRPVGYVCTEPNAYITDYTCSGENEHQVHEVRLSFFSGHSSTAIYTAVLIAVYLEARLAPRNLLPQARRTVQVSLTLAALVVCATRVTDNFHHPSDVIVGILFGVAAAVITASSLAGLCSYDMRPVQQPKGRTIFAKFISQTNQKD